MWVAVALVAGIVIGILLGWLILWFAMIVLDWQERPMMDDSGDWLG